jgi:cytochrome c oxidase subunit 2
MKQTNSCNPVFARVELRTGALLLGALALLGLCGCTDVLSLQPKGPAAQGIADLGWFAFFLALPFFLAVVILLLLAIRRHGRGEVNPRNHGMKMIVWGGAILPAFAMLALMSHTIYTLVAVTEPAAFAEISIEVQGKMWWWKVGYSNGEAKFYSANEIHIPAGEPVALELSSDNVIHSFWVPELHGKRDLIPGIPGHFWIQADNPGTYHGQCAEFCGAQHAKMHFLVIAHEPAEFALWLERESRPARLLVEGDEYFRGQQVFREAGCASCHTIRGTTAAGIIGPDLTHMADRRDLAAGTLPNVTGNLAAWIVDSQHFKPGNLMPPMPLQPVDLIDITDYLLSLR